MFNIPGESHLRRRPARVLLARRGGVQHRGRRGPEGRPLPGLRGRGRGHQEEGGDGGGGGGHDQHGGSGGGEEHLSHVPTAARGLRINQFLDGLKA